MPVEEFDRDYVDRLSSARDHAWVRGMERASLAILGDLPAGPRAVLDAGSGSGNNLGWLTSAAAGGRVQAVDVATAAVQRLHERAPAGVDVLQASVVELPYADESFDLVASTDVLQHLTSKDADRAVLEMFRLLRPGGSVLVRTNAAFGRGAVSEREDWRLYTPDLLGGVLRAAGFDVRRVTHANATLGLWASRDAIRRRLPGGRRGHDHGHGHSHAQDHASSPEAHGIGIPTEQGVWRSRAVRAVLTAEASWLRRGGLPFGHSLYGHAVRPERPAATAPRG